MNANPFPLSLRWVGQIAVAVRFQQPDGTFADGVERVKRDARGTVIRYQSSAELELALFVLDAITLTPECVQAEMEKRK